MTTHILLAARQQSSRSALRLFFQDERELDVVGEAADSEELLAEVGTKHPNVVLLAWGLPGQPAKDLLPALRALNSRLVVIVLSGRPEVEQLARAAGADGFVNLCEPPRYLLETLQNIPQAK